MEIKEKKQFMVGDRAFDSAKKAKEYINGIERKKNNKVENLRKLKEDGRTYSIPVKILSARPTIDIANYCSYYKTFEFKLGTSRLEYLDEALEIITAEEWMQELPKQSFYITRERYKDLFETAIEFNDLAENKMDWRELAVFMAQQSIYSDD